MTCNQALEKTTKWNAAKNHVGQFVSESDAVHTTATEYGTGDS